MQTMMCSRKDSALLKGWTERSFLRRWDLSRDLKGQRERSIHVSVRGGRQQGEDGEFQRQGTKLTALCKGVQVGGVK